VNIDLAILSNLGVSIDNSTGQIVISTDFGIVRRNYFEAKVDSSLENMVCGLSGNYTGGNKADDFTKPDGTLAGSPDEFGKSWVDPNDPK
jgi:hypothetical protein